MASVEAQAKCDRKTRFEEVVTDRHMQDNRAAVAYRLAVAGAPPSSVSSRTMRWTKTTSGTRRMPSPARRPLNSDASK
eukprot:3302784-Prymnesium_polylepis.2